MAYTQQRMLTEYLYVDQQRLDAYFDQISGPVQYDKVPVWKAEASILGLKTEGSQARFARPFTSHEKVSTLLGFLRERNLLKTPVFLQGSPPDDSEFVLAKCAATRLALPLSKISEAGTLYMWVAHVDLVAHAVTGLPESASSSYVLFLLEDSQAPDSRATRFSSYTLFRVWGDDFWAVIGREWNRPEYDHPDLDVSAGILSLSKAARVPDVNPIETLVNMGAQPGEERKIACLYRTRATFFEKGRDSSIPCVYGYPVFIAAGSAPLDVTRVNDSPPGLLARLRGMFG